MAFITAETRSSIVELAMGMLNQAPSTALLNTLIAKSVEGASIQDLADYLATTDAFTAEYPATQTAREFATEMFGKLITGGTLDAAINTAVIDLLEGLLIAGTTKAEGFVAVINFLADSANALHPDLGDIAQSFQNRADAAEYFSITKELGGSTAAELAAAIASVTSDAATLTAANTAADGTASAEAVVAGQTFTLTAGADIAGKSQASSSALAVDFRFTDGGNEVISADIGTLGATDVLLDGSSADSDVLNVSSNGSSGTFTANRIETINFEGVAGSPVLDMTNVNGTNAINVSGAVNAKIDALDAQIKQPMITADTFARNLNIDLVTTAGTAAAGTAETVNLTVKGAALGASAATTSSVTIEAAAGATLETLNITSVGEAANAFALDASTNAAFSKVNFLGSQSVTALVSSADVTGISLIGTEATGVVTVRIDKNGDTTTATNVNNFAGIDVLAMADGTTPGTGGDSASLTGLKSGQIISLGDDFNATTFTFAAVTGTSDTATIILDNETAATDLDVASINIQDIETLTIQSSGNVSDSTTAQNQIGNAAAGGAALVGDATTINITGDTSLAIDIDIDRTALNGARSVTVDASTNTAFVNILAEADSKIGYSITGTGGKDTLTLNNTAGTLIGGAGDDILTGGSATDVIDAGDGDDEINVSTGTDTLTGGAGDDTYDVDALNGAAVAEVITSGDTDGGLTTVAADDDFVVTVNGASYKLDIATDGDTGDDIAADFVAAFGTTILAAHGVTVSTTAVVANASGSLLFTGAADGTDFTATVGLTDNGTFVDVTETATTAGVAATDVASTITDFAKGDVLDLAGALTEAGIGYYEGAAAGGAATTNVWVLTDPGGFADAEAAEDAIVAGTASTDTADGVIVFINSTLGFAQVVYDDDVDVDAANLGSSTGANVIFNLVGITTATELAAAFSTGSFTL